MQITNYIKQKWWTRRELNPSPSLLISHIYAKSKETALRRGVVVLAIFGPGDDVVMTRFCLESEERSCVICFKALDKCLCGKEAA